MDINVTSDRAPRRVYSRSPISAYRPSLVNQINTNNHLYYTKLISFIQQAHFRNTFGERDRKCAISGKSPRAKHRPFLGLSSTYIYPVSRIDGWNAHYYRRWVTDTNSPEKIGNSGIFSPQNGLLLMAGIDMIWDAWGIGIDLDVFPFIPHLCSAIHTNY